jgi:hypothetical protein
MIFTCANPLCSESFRHGAGSLFCFPHPALDAATSEKQSEVQHFWLCFRCSETFTLENKLGRIELKPRWRVPEPDDPPKLVAAA